MNTQTYKASILGFLTVINAIAVWTFGIDHLNGHKTPPQEESLDVEIVTVPHLGAHFSQQRFYAPADTTAVIKKEIPFLKPSAVLVEDVQEVAVHEPEVAVAVEVEEIKDHKEDKENKEEVVAAPVESQPSELESWELSPTWTIAIPSLNIRAPVLLPSRTHWDSRAWTLLEEQMQVGLNNGSVAYPHSATPGGVGNLIIAGHSSPPDEASAASNFGHLFARLPDIAIGDEVQVGTATYRVDEKFVVPPSEVSILAQQQDESILKLITCYPVGTTKNRMIITAKKVE